MQTFSIGQVARETGVSVETIRFYERRGLIDEPPRLKSGYRRYGSQDIRRLKFIQQAKVLGFSLREIDELLRLRARRGSTSREIRAFARAKIEQIDARIDLLQRMRRTLNQLARKCSGTGPSSECPILQALDGG